MSTSGVAKDSSARSSTGVDIHVGLRLFAKRKMLGWSLAQLGNALGISPYQIQKYEQGANRVSASRLYELAKIFKVSVDYFFEELNVSPTLGTRDTEGFYNEQTEQAKIIKMILSDSDALAFVLAYYRIPNGHMRSHVKRLIKALAQDRT